VKELESEPAVSLPGNRRTLQAVIASLMGQDFRVTQSKDP
jgi:hypothetical protein